MTSYRAIQFIKQQQAYNKHRQNKHKLRQKKFPECIGTFPECKNYAKDMSVKERPECKSCPSCPDKEEFV